MRVINDVGLADELDGLARLLPPRALLGKPVRVAPALRLRPVKRAPLVCRQLPTEPRARYLHPHLELGLLLRAVLLDQFHAESTRSILHACRGSAPGKCQRSGRRAPYLLAIGFSPSQVLGCALTLHLLPDRSALEPGAW